VRGLTIDPLGASYFPTQHLTDQIETYTRYAYITEESTRWAHHPRHIDTGYPQHDISTNMRTIHASISWNAPGSKVVCGT